MQKTLFISHFFEGIGLHSGKSCTLTVYPTGPNHGIWFKRTDVLFGDPMIPARWDRVQQSPLCTRLVNESGVAVSTVEHLMAALSGCGIHNALVEIDGEEMPILDGSAEIFVRAFLDGGIKNLDAPLTMLKILKPICFETDNGWARIEPSDQPEMTFQIDFEDAAIGVQKKTLNMSNGSFVRELCDSRTFCRNRDVQTMRKNGLALGGSFDNAVVVEGDQILTPGGLRHKDEAVRHKMLDALGDLALAGAPILGRYVGHKAGHAITNSLLRALFSRPDAFSFEICDHATAQILPGAGARADEICAVA